MLYEGYLLYPYRANSSKNQSRWQFGVLGPAGAAEAGIGEDDSLSAQFLVDAAGQRDGVASWCASCSCSTAASSGHGGGGFEPVDELIVGRRDPG